jgi:phenylacetate-CoA ligase
MVGTTEASVMTAATRDADRRLRLTPDPVKDTIGASVEVLVVDPETLARSAGKLQRLWDLRDRS